MLDRGTGQAFGDERLEIAAQLVAAVLQLAADLGEAKQVGGHTGGIPPAA